MAVLAPEGVGGRHLVACDPVLHKLNCPTHRPLRAATETATVFPKIRLLVGWLVGFPLPTRVVTSIHCLYDDAFWPDPFCSLFWPSLAPQDTVKQKVEDLVAGTSSVQFSSVAQSCLSLCDPMNCSTPGLPVHHQLPEFTQTHVHQVGNGIQPSHPLSSPFSLALNLSQHQGLCK